MDMSEVRDKLVYIFENLFNYRNSEDEQHTHGHEYYVRLATWNNRPRIYITIHDEYIELGDDPYLQDTVALRLLGVCFTEGFIQNIRRLSSKPCGIVLDTANPDVLGISAIAFNGRTIIESVIEVLYTLAQSRYKVMNNA